MPGRNPANEQGPRLTGTTGSIAYRAGVWRDLKGWHRTTAMMAMTAAMMARSVPIRRMTVRMIINVVMVVAVIIATPMIPMATPKINAERSNTDVLRHSRPNIESGGGGKQSEPE